MENTGGCNSCGSSSFEEIAGLFYCSICSTQRTGFTVEVGQFENLPEVRSEVYLNKKRKKKEKDFGELWTNLEAFNHILNHQCTQLEKKLKLGPEFRAILFSLWTIYLEKCELAFTGNKNDKPKTNLTSRYRDTQLIGQGMAHITVPLRASKGSQERKKCGNTILQRNAITKYGDDAKSVKSEPVVSLPSGSNSDHDHDDDDDDDDGDDLNARLQENDESRTNRYEDDYGEVEEEDTRRKLDLTCLEGENFDMDDVPIVEWTEEMQENFLFNYNYNTLFIESLKPFAYQASILAEGSSRPSKPFSANATKAITYSDIELKRVDIDGLKPLSKHGPISGGANIRRLARTYLRRYDDGGDFDELMKELDRLFKKSKEKSRKKRKLSPSKEQNEDGQGTDGDVDSEGADGDADVQADGVADVEGANEDADGQADGVTEPPVKKIELTKRSQLMKKIAEGAGLDPRDAKKLWMNHSHFLTMEKMSMSRTLQFLYLAFRVGGYNVYVGDILHWILRGHLTFFGAHAILPERWYILSVSDILSYVVKLLPQPKRIDFGGGDLRRFLSVPDLPLPDLNEMAMRHLHDLNLPLQLADLIAQKVDYTLIKKIARTRYRIDANSTNLPDFSITSICAIIVILFKLYNIDNEGTEKLISAHVRQNWPGSFVFDDWYKDNEKLWTLMGQHYFPGQPELYKDIPDVDVIRYHREQLTNHWFGGAETKYSIFNSVSTSSSFRNTYAKAIIDTFGVEPCTVEPPPFTVYHFYEAKKFIANRITQTRGSSALSSFPSSLSSPSQPINIFDANYTTKTIDYLFDESFTGFNRKPFQLNYWKKRNVANFERWPETLRILVKIACFITHRPNQIICTCITGLIKHINL